MHGGVHLTFVAAAVALLLVGCDDAAESDRPSPSSSTTTGPSASSTTGLTSDAGTTAAPAIGGATGDCSFEGDPLVAGDSVEVAVIGERDGVIVRAAVYPRPDYEGNPWSQWGQGIVAPDGRFFSAIGDHLGADGNSFLYEYDPETRRLTMVADMLSRLDHVPGTWGYGKIHSQMVAGPCGEVYFSTYWGTRRDIEFEGNYTGDVLFRLDPGSDTLQPLGVPIEHHGQASLASAPDLGMVFGEAADPMTPSGEDSGPFFAYDTANGEVVFTGPEQPHVGYRSILADGDGVAHYSIGDGRLQRFDPVSGQTTTHEASMPGEWLRAATTPDPDGWVYGVTREPDVFFAMQPDGSIEGLGEALGYTASMALHPDGSAFYYMPGAHGNSAEWGSPLMEVDTETGEQQVVVELAEMVREGLGLTVGGTYNVAVDPDGETVYLGLNAGAQGSDSTFGEVVLVLVELP